MDPKANIEEQRRLAASIIAWFDSDVEGEQTPQADDVARLAELVIALDEWRTNGGFDPYLTEET